MLCTSDEVIEGIWEFEATMSGECGCGLGSRLLVLSLAANAVPGCCVIWYGVHTHTYKLGVEAGTDHK